MLKSVFSIIFKGQIARRSLIQLNFNTYIYANFEKSGTNILKTN